MKKFILLLLIASIGAVACKKEKKSSTRVDKPIGEAIKGTWFTTAETHDYYNANNEKIFTSTVEPGWKYTIDDRLRIWNPEGVRTLLTDYTVTSVNGKNVFNYTEKGVAKSFEISNLEQEVMSFRREESNVEYNDNGVKTAAKAITTMDFHCPCK